MGKSEQTRDEVYTEFVVNFNRQQVSRQVMRQGWVCSRKGGVGGTIAVVVGRDYMVRFCM